MKCIYEVTMPKPCRVYYCYYFFKQLVQLLMDLQVNTHSFLCRSVTRDKTSDILKIFPNMAHSSYCGIVSSSDVAESCLSYIPFLVVTGLSVATIPWMFILTMVDTCDWKSEGHVVPMQNIRQNHPPPHTFSTQGRKVIGYIMTFVTWYVRLLEHFGLYWRMGW